MPTLGLAMIVKNGGDELRDCLRSAAPIVQQMAIADTGSTDNTREILREFGATLVDFPWTNHYGEARNAAMAPLTTDWVLVLDADEELDAEAVRQLPALLAGIPAKVGAVRLQVRIYVPERQIYANGALSREYSGSHPRAKGALSTVDVGMFRLFRRHPEICYSERIHEVIDPSVLAAGFSLAGSELVIHNFGKLIPPENQARKDMLYCEMLRIAVEEHPDMAHLWVQLGKAEQWNCRNEDEAIRCYERAVELGGFQPDAWVELARIWTRRKEFARALAMLERLNGTADMEMQACGLKGDVLHGMMQLSEAREMYWQALRLARKVGLGSSFALSFESKLGYVEAQMGLEQMGLDKTGLRRMRQAVEGNPRILEFHDRLVRSLVLLKRDREAAEAAEAICHYFVSEPIFARAAALWMRVNEVERCEKILAAGLRLFPASERLQKLATGLQAAVPLS